MQNTRQQSCRVFWIWKGDGRCMGSMSRVYGLGWIVVGVGVAEIEGGGWKELNQAFGCGPYHITFSSWC